MSDDSILLLSDECAASVPSEHLAARRNLLEQLRRLPPQALTNLQYLQPQVGCFNRCAFCSQSAGADIWQLTRQGLRNFVAALAYAARDYSGAQCNLAANRVHKPRILFPYMDNDIGAYPYLDEYVNLVYSELGCRIRLTTVGYSSQNAHLVAMHHRIAETYTKAIAGFRLSFTPFTYGWTVTAQRSGSSYRHQFIWDVANALKTYRPVLDYLGPGHETFCVELRFKPLVEATQVIDTLHRGHHIIFAAPYLLVSLDKTNARPLPVSVVELLNNRPGNRDATSAPVPVFSSPPTHYLLAMSYQYDRKDIGLLVDRLLCGTLHEAEANPVDVYSVRNRDGVYYAINPGISIDGSFRALHIYPATAARRGGYNDASRHFLNSLIQYKREHGFSRRGDFESATWANVDDVLDRIRQLAQSLSAGHPAATYHILNDIVPLVQDYAKVLRRSGLPARYFFSSSFTIDTGQAINQGRARGLFRGLASVGDEPMTVWEERSNLISKGKGRVWRMSPVPFDLQAGQPLVERLSGKKNVSGPKRSMLVQELDAQYLQPIDRTSGARLREFLIEDIELEHVDAGHAGRNHLYPGAI